MKRTYINPICTVIEVHYQGMLASSTINVSSSNYDEGSMTDLVKENPFSSNSIWDDDWSVQ